MKAADIVLKSNAIFTGLDDAPRSGAIAIVGNKIDKVIGGEDIDGLIDKNSKVYDCVDKLIMPGFIDAHVHFFTGAVTSSHHICMDIEKSKSADDCIRITKNHFDNYPDAERILGFGWFPANWDDAPLPDKHSLDEAFPDKPAYLFCADAHTVWVNSKALEESNITKNTIPPYGEVVKGADGEPSGILLEGACFLVMSKLTSFPPTILREIFTDFLKEIAAYGITSLSDMTASTMDDDFIKLFSVIKEIEKDGCFTSRLNVYSSLGPCENYEAEKGLREKYGHSGIVRYAGLKHLVDGVTSTYTGLLLEPYSDRPDTCGMSNFDKRFYEEHVIRANKENLGVRLHCIADKSVRWALDIFEKSNKENDNIGNMKGLKNSIEHIEHIHPDDIPRFKELGVIASMQPYHLTLDVNEKIRRVGKERCMWEWPHRSLLDHGAILAFGTDYPVVSFNPFANIYAATTRCADDGQPTGCNPNERITLSEALKAYTFGGAFSYDMENETGTLAEGKLADIVVINKNLFDIPLEEIPNCDVDLTICDGKVIFSRS